jgi:hypothetical protein
VFWQVKIEDDNSFFGNYSLLLQKITIPGPPFLSRLSLGIERMQERASTHIGKRKPIAEALLIEFDQGREL